MRTSGLLSFTFTQSRFFSTHVHYSRFRSGAGQRPPHQLVRGREGESAANQKPDSRCTEQEEAETERPGERQHSGRERRRVHAQQQVTQRVLSRFLAHILFAGLFIPLFLSTAQRTKISAHPEQTTMKRRKTKTRAVMPAAGIAELAPDGR